MWILRRWTKKKPPPKEDKPKESAYEWVEDEETGTMIKVLKDNIGKSMGGGKT